jgi:hypothetical protein
MDEETLNQPIIDEDQLDQLITNYEIGEDLDNEIEHLMSQFSQLEIKYQALLKTRNFHLNA